jgi:beta-xylosidase
MQEDAHTPASLRGILDKLAPSHLSFCLENLPAEQYTIKASIVSPQYGSVLDEWLRLNTMTDIRKEDIDYLRRICTPHLFIQEKPTENGKLSFHVDLQPEELALIHIYQAQ